jgi:hypothetical protein
MGLNYHETVGNSEIAPQANEDRVASGHRLCR